MNEQSGTGVIHSNKSHPTGFNDINNPENDTIDPSLYIPISSPKSHLYKCMIDLCEHRHKSVFDINAFLSPKFNYKILKMLGGGIEGKVFLATIENHPNQPHYAIKRISISNKVDLEEQIKLLLRVIYVETLQRSTKLIHIVPHFDIYFKEFNNTMKGEIEYSLFIVMKYCELGSLEDIIYKYNNVYKNEYLDGELKLKWIIDMTSTLMYFHERKLVHLDLKPDNILLSCSDRNLTDQNSNFKEILSKSNIYLSDFGLTREFRVGELPLMNITGSRNYMAPEVSVGKYYNESVDIWALGMVTLQLLVQKRRNYLDSLRNEFQNCKNNLETHQVIENFILSSMKEENNNLISLLLDRGHKILFNFVYQCLNLDSSERLNALECLQFLQLKNNNNNNSIINNILKVDIAKKFNSLNFLIYKMGRHFWEQMFGNSVKVSWNDFKDCYYFFTKSAFHSRSEKVFKYLLCNHQFLNYNVNTNNNNIVSIYNFINCIENCNHGLFPFKDEYFNYLYTDSNLVNEHFDENTIHHLGEHFLNLILNITRINSLFNSFKILFDDVEVFIKELNIENLLEINHIEHKATRLKKRRAAITSIRNNKEILFEEKYPICHVIITKNSNFMDIDLSFLLYNIFQYCLRFNYLKKIPLIINLKNILKLNLNFIDAIVLGNFNYLFGDIKLNYHSDLQSYLKEQIINGNCILIFDNLHLYKGQDYNELINEISKFTNNTIYLIDNTVNDNYILDPNNNLNFKDYLLKKIELYPFTVNNISTLLKNHFSEFNQNDFRFLEITRIPSFCIFYAKKDAMSNDNVLKLILENFLNEFYISNDNNYLTVFQQHLQEMLMESNNDNYENNNSQYSSSSLSPSTSNSNSLAMSYLLNNNNGNSEHSSTDQGPTPVTGGLRHSAGSVIKSNRKSITDATSPSSATTNTSSSSRVFDSIPLHNPSSPTSPRSPTTNGNGLKEEKKEKRSKSLRLSFKKSVSPNTTTNTPPINNPHFTLFNQMNAFNLDDKRRISFTNISEFVKSEKLLTPKEFLDFFTDLAEYLSLNKLEKFRKLQDFFIEKPNYYKLIWKQLKIIFKIANNHFFQFFLNYIPEFKFYYMPKIVRELLCGLQWSKKEKHSNVRYFKRKNLKTVFKPKLEIRTSTLKKYFLDSYYRNLFYNFIHFLDLEEFKIFLNKMQKEKVNVLEEKIILERILLRNLVIDKLHVIETNEKKIDLKEIHMIESTFRENLKRGILSKYDRIQNICLYQLKKGNDLSHEIFLNVFLEGMKKNMLKIENLNIIENFLLYCQQFYLFEQFNILLMKMYNTNLNYLFILLNKLVNKKQTNQQQQIVDIYIQLLKKCINDFLKSEMNVTQPSLLINQNFNNNLNNNLETKEILFEIILLLKNMLQEDDSIQESITILLEYLYQQFEYIKLNQSNAYQFIKYLLKILDEQTNLFIYDKLTNVVKSIIEINQKSKIYHSKELNLTFYEYLYKFVDLFEQDETNLGKLINIFLLLDFDVLQNEYFLNLILKIKKNKENIIYLILNRIFENITISNEASILQKRKLIDKYLILAKSVIILLNNGELDYSLQNKIIVNLLNYYNGNIHLMEQHISLFYILSNVNQLDMSKVSGELLSKCLQELLNNNNEEDDTIAEFKNNLLFLLYQNYLKILKIYLKKLKKERLEDLSIKLILFIENRKKFYEMPTHLIIKTFKLFSYFPIASERIIRLLIDIVNQSNELFIIRFYATYYLNEIFRKDENLSNVTAMSVLQVEKSFIEGISNLITSSNDEKLLKHVFHLIQFSKNQREQLELVIFKRILKSKDDDQQIIQLAFDTLFSKYFIDVSPLKSLDYLIQFLSLDHLKSLVIIKLFDIIAKCHELKIPIELNEEHVKKLKQYCQLEYFFILHDIYHI
ncbi:hypothetical protein ABK040_006633 [Willaertia magna]